MATWTAPAIDMQCDVSHRAYERELEHHYTAYYAAHPEVADPKQRWSAASTAAALPDGHHDLVDGLSVKWHTYHRSGKSSQTRLIGLLGPARKADPNLEQFLAALGGLPVSGGAVTSTFESSVAPQLLRETGQTTAVDLLIETATMVLCVEAKVREPGVDRCDCPHDGAVCNAKRSSRPRYWASAKENFGLPDHRVAGQPCPLHVGYQAIRNAAAARAIAGQDRLAVFVLLYDELNPYFRPTGTWPGWSAVLTEQVGANADSEIFAFRPLSWQQLAPQLPLDPATRSWASQLHRLPT